AWPAKDRGAFRRSSPRWRRRMTASRRWSRTCSAAGRPAASRGRNCSPRRSPRSRASSIAPARSISKHMLTVHVRVSDAATGQPTPVRIRLIDCAGVCRMPFGRLTEFATGPDEDVGGQVQLDGDAFAHIDGVCEVRLPPGPVRVEVHKGPEYLPLQREVVLGPGKIALRLAIERWIDPHEQGWYSGDCRAHELSPHAARLEGAAEGLDVVNLLARERPPRGERPAAFVNLLAFSGTRPALDGSPYVVVNTYNTHPVLGTVALLNSHRPVYPLRFGAPDGLDDWSVSDWCDQC